MDLVFPNQGLKEQLQRILTSGFNWRLFTNNITPTRSNVLSDFTEAIFSGYAPWFQQWTDFTLNGVSGNTGYAIAPPVAFSNSSGSDQQVYGYFVTDTGNTMVVAAARFDGAPVTIPNGSSIAVVPTWGDVSQLPA
jgi:hypothetical protein